jgi:hypothetical protein
MNQVERTKFLDFFKGFLFKLFIQLLVLYLLCSNPIVEVLDFVTLKWNHKQLREKTLNYFLRRQYDIPLNKNWLNIYQNQLP